MAATMPTGKAVAGTEPAAVALPRCAVCRRHHRTLLGDGSPVRLCNACFERLDQLDRDHPNPAFNFAAAIVHNRTAAHMEGVE